MTDHPLRKRFSFPIDRRSCLLVGILCAAAVLLVIAGKISPLANVPKWDEFIVVYDAQRVISGQVPYRDFFNFIPPGIFLALAAWFRLFSVQASVTWGRYFSTLVAFVSWLWIARNMRRAGWGRNLSLALSSLYPLCLYAFWPIPSHHWLADLVIIASFEAYDFEGGRVRGTLGWLWIGVSGGLAFLFLQTAALDMAVLWGILWLLGTGRKEKLRGACLSLAGVVGVLGPVLAWFLAKGALGDLFYDVFSWTAHHYRVAGGVNAVPLLQDLPDRVLALWHPPPVYNGWLWVPLAVAGTVVFATVLSAAGAVLVLSGVSFGRILARRRLPGALTSAVLCLTVVDFTLFLMGKPDWLHLIYAVGTVGPAWLLLIPSRERFQGKPRVFWAWTAGLLVLVSMAYGAGWMCFAKPSLWEFTDADRPVRDAPINRYLRSRAWLGSRDTIAAFPEGGEVYLYVRPAAVGYTLVYPPDESYYSRKDYATIVAQILKNRPKCILMTVDSAPAFLSPSSPLRAPIIKNYTELGRLGNTVIFRLKEGA